MKLLTYNCQQGKLGLELIQELMARPNDYYCFQRFPEEWLSIFPDLFSYYQPSFNSCKFGCATFSLMKLNSTKGNTSNKVFADACQSTAFVSLHTPNLQIVNTLPPFELGETKYDDYAQHVQFLLQTFQSPTLIVGDFHFEDSELPQNFFLPFVNRLSKDNFFDRRGHPTQLSKILCNRPLTVISETVIDLPKEPVKHLPVEFEYDEPKYI